jgi:putative ABC transport system permease protein
MSNVLRDLRYCLRQLIKAPGFTLTAIVSLTLGIGATTAVFSVVYAVLMNPYPYAAADRMVHMRLLDSAGHENGFGLTGAQWQAIRKSPVVEDAFATDGWSLTVTGRDLPEDVEASYFTSNGFNFMGVRPALGRGLVPSDAVDGQEPQPVAVLSYKFWQRHFGSDPSVVGNTLQLVRKTYTIVGVAAPRFTWDDADVYLPLKVTLDPTRDYYVGLRLKPGVSQQAANAALQPLIEQFAKQTPKHFPQRKFRFKVVGLNEDFEKRLGGTLYLLFAAVAFLLLIGCGNVSILQLARGAGRQHEFAVRAAIGAGRMRLVRQMLTEALLLSLTGAVLGVLLAFYTVRVIARLLPTYSFPHEAAIQLNMPVLAFSVALALVTGVLFGLWPSLQLSRPDVAQVMQASLRRIVGGRGRVMNNILIAGQIALTLVMLAGAGAAMRGFVRLLHTPLGYDPHNIMSVGIPVHDGTCPTWEARSAYFEALLNKVAAAPGVTMAAISTNATPPSNGWNTSIEIMGKARRDDQKVRVNFVNQAYFPILRIPLAQGRLWSEAENHIAAHVAVINETMARLYFPNGAIGHALKIPDMKSEPPFSLSPSGDDPWLQIIGVAADKRDDGLSKPILPEAFIPYTLNMRMWTQILVRSDVSPLSLLHAIGKQVNSVDSDQQISGEINDLEHWIQNEPEWQQEHLVAWLFGAFAVLALALAATGLYSVVSFSVAQRTNEFGVRMALGAQRGDVLRVVFASAVVSVGSGIAAGIVLTFALNKVLANWAEGSSRDVVVLLSATALLCVVAGAACAAPAHRASSVDPMTALRYE